MTTYDVAVIGGGAAGLSAALVLTRARRSVAVVDSGAPRNAPATRMQGFLSRDGMAPTDLLAAGRLEVTSYGGHLVSGTVDDVRRTHDQLFLLRLSDGREATARCVLVTTGLRDELPEVPGVRERWGRDLLHCPYCHGYEVRDQPVGVLGGSFEAIQHAQLIRQWASDVVLFTDMVELTADQRERLVARAVGIVEDAVSRLVVVDDRLVGVELADGRVVRRSAVFVRPRLVADNVLLTGLGCAIDDAGWVVADATGATTEPGVWVAGNVSDPRAQVITAAGEGSATAIAINADLVEDDIRRAVRDFRAGVLVP